jgi:Peptidase dimerisation domain
MLSTKELQQLLISIESRLPAFLAEIHTTLSLSKKSSILLQTLIQEQLQQHGLSGTPLDAEGTLLSTEIVGTSSKTILLYYHYNKDTDTPTVLLPFLISLITLALYRTLVKPLPINIKWLIDGRGTAQPAMNNIAQHLQADYILWTELSIHPLEKPSLALGVKGYLSTSFEIETALTSLPSSYGAIVPNAAWRLLWALASLKDAQEGILIDGFYDMLIPASDQSIEQLYTLETPDPPEGVPAFLHKLRGFQLHYAHLLIPTCSITSIESEPTNQQEGILLSRRARAQVDFYLVPEQNPDEILDKLREHLLKHGFSDLALERRSGSYPLHLLPTHPFTVCLQQAIVQSYGAEPILLPLSAENFPFATSSQQVPLLVQHIDLLSNSSNSSKESMLDENKCAHAIKTLICLLERLPELDISSHLSAPYPKLPPKY